MQFIWRPYTNDIISRLPAYCLSGREVWQARVPLVCFYMVEWHLPDRVQRQFGFRQPIPQPCDTERHLHIWDLRGHPDTDWGHTHGEYVARWDSRREAIVTGEAWDGTIDPRDPYLDWYRSITRWAVGRDGAFHGYLVSFFNYLLNRYVINITLTNIRNFSCRLSHSRRFVISASSRPSELCAILCYRWSVRAADISGHGPPLFQIQMRSHRHVVEDEGGGEGGGGGLPPRVHLRRAAASFRGAAPVAMAR